MAPHPVPSQLGWLWVGCSRSLSREVNVRFHDFDRLIRTRKNPPSRPSSSCGPTSSMPRLTCWKHFRPCCDFFLPSKHPHTNRYMGEISQHAHCTLVAFVCMSLQHKSSIFIPFFMKIPMSLNPSPLVANSAEQRKLR